MTDSTVMDRSLAALGDRYREAIHLQSPSENLGFYVRVIPDWVNQMKRAVDAANR